MKRYRIVAGGVLLLAVTVLAGCSSSSQGTLTGTVTWNNEPLKEGTVSFIPTDGKSQTSSATITDGKFTAKDLPLTTMKVQFSSPKPTGKKKKVYDTPDSPEIDIVDELLPAKYNTGSTITITIKGGNQEEKFDLVK
jgi:hypothetical protein